MGLGNLKGGQGPEGYRAIERKEGEVLHFEICKCSNSVWDKKILSHE
jgi:hypothetical protein